MKLWPCSSGSRPVGNWQAYVRLARSIGETDGWEAGPMGKTSPAAG